MFLYVLFADYIHNLSDITVNEVINIIRPARASAVAFFDMFDKMILKRVFCYFFKANKEGIEVFICPFFTKFKYTTPIDSFKIRLRILAIMYSSPLVLSWLLNSSNIASLD
jgi:hypothetical protein